MNNKLLFKNSGISYVEIVVSIGLFLVLALILDTLLIASFLQQKSKFITIAHQLAQEELEILKNKPLTELTATTSAPFTNIHFHKGVIRIKNDASSVSPPNVIDLSGNTSGPANVTAQLLLPKNSYQEGALTYELMVRDNSPANWQAGVLFRSTDEYNGYLLNLNSTNWLTLDLLQAGIKTNLINLPYATSLNVWHTLELSFVGDAISLKINGFAVFSTTDATHTNGYLSLTAGQGAHLLLDNIIMNDATENRSWTFDTENEGELLGEWERQGLNSLPNGTGNITISDYLGDVNIKSISAEVQWSEKGLLKSTTLTTLITE